MVNKIGFDHLGTSVRELSGEKLVLVARLEQCHRRSGEGSTDAKLREEIKK